MAGGRGWDPKDPGRLLIDDFYRLDVCFFREKVHGFEHGTFFILSEIQG